MTLLVPYLILGSRGRMLNIGWLSLFGLSLILIGTAGLIWCIWQFFAEGRGTLAPVDPPKELVINGLYQIVRNPMYVSVLLILIGESLFFASTGILIEAAIFFAATHLFTVFYEEPYLKHQFGPIYENYQHTVGRWLPRLQTKRQAYDTFGSIGIYLLDEYLSPEECAALRDKIAHYRREHGDVLVERDGGERPLKYSVIDGVKIKEHLPDVTGLYERVNELVNRISSLKLVPLENEQVSCNINIMGAGNTYRWHYDRNAVTAILYLNDIEGGETECYANYRISLGNARFSKFQRILDKALQPETIRKIFGRHRVVAPKAGRLLVMRGDRCLHSVRPVTGDEERINLIMSYDLPGTKFSVDERLDGYLYGHENADGSDPNYV